MKLNKDGSWAVRVSASVKYKQTPGVKIFAEARNQTEQVKH